MANQSILRGEQILALFSLARPQISISEIAREMKLAVSTVHGLVRSLVQAGLMVQAPDSRGYRLGMRLIELAAIQMATLEINQKAAMPASNLAQETGFFIHIAVYERMSMVITYSTSPLAAGPGKPHLGSRSPAYCTSSGRSVLAHLPDSEVEDYFEKAQLVKYTPKTITDKSLILAELNAIRERGYAIVQQELQINLDHVGAPIFNANGEVIGGISLNGDSRQMGKANLEQLGLKVMDTAAQISALMGQSFQPVFQS